MKRKFSTVVVSSLIFLVFIGFNMMDTKPKMIFDDPSSVAPGNTLDLNNSNFSDKTYNDQGSIIYNTDNSLAYLEEGFESTTFPPPGWVRVNELIVYEIVVDELFFFILFSLNLVLVNE